MVGLFILACVAFLAASGYFQGLTRQIIGIAAFVMACFLGGLAGGLIPDAWLQRMDVPLALVPGVKLALGSIIVLAATTLVGRAAVKMLRMRKNKEVAAKQKKQDHFRGAIFGGVKGMLFAMIILMVVSTLGQVAEVVEPKARAAAREARADGGASAGGNAEPEAVTIKQRATQGSGLRHFLARAKRQIASSAAGPLVKAASVLDAKMLQSLEDIIDITNDRDSLRRLQQHADVQKLMEIQQIRDITQDPAVVEAAKKRDLFALLNHPGVAALAQNPQLKQAVKTVDLDAIIAHAKGEGTGGKERE